MLLQIFGFYCDFLGALSVGYARKAELWRRRGEKQEERRNISVSSCQMPWVLLSDLLIVSALGGAQLMLAAQESSILSFQ